DPGWQKAWNARLPPDRQALIGSLACYSSYATWRDVGDASDEETRPINCVSWYVAEAFCIWDNGRLPTDAEWELAAAGGSELRLYPWGDAAPGPSADLAVYSC